MIALCALRLSNSKITDFNNCPKKYGLRYVKKMAEKAMPQLTLGKNLHSKYESFYRLLPDVIENEDQIKKIFEETCLCGANGEEAPHLNNFLDMNMKTFADLKEKNLLKHFKPIKIEQKYYDEDKDFVGVIDAIFEIGDRTLVVDWKTSSYKDGKESYYRQQLAGYKHLYEKFNDKEVTDWGIFFSGNGHFYVEPCSSRTMFAFHRKLDETKHRIEEGLKTGKFEKGTRSWCNWCGYWEHCWEES